MLGRRASFTGVGKNGVGFVDPNGLNCLVLKVFRSILIAGGWYRGGLGACPQETVRFSRIQVCPKDTP